MTTSTCRLFGRHRLVMPGSCRCQACSSVSRSPFLFFSVCLLYWSPTESWSTVWNKTFFGLLSLNFAEACEALSSFLNNGGHAIVLLFGARCQFKGKFTNKAWLQLEVKLWCWSIDVAVWDSVSQRSVMCEYTSGKNPHELALLHRLPLRFCTLVAPGNTLKTIRRILSFLTAMYCAASVVPRDFVVSFIYFFYACHISLSFHC